jgi:NaMN:DMB phosphoribosyltransferase
VADSSVASGETRNFEGIVIKFLSLLDLDPSLIPGAAPSLRQEERYETMEAEDRGEVEESMALLVDKRDWRLGGLSRIASGETRNFEGIVIKFLSLLDLDPSLIPGAMEAEDRGEVEESMALLVDKRDWRLGGGK